MLLGGDILPQILRPESKTGPQNTPSAWNTIFGWAILGPFQPFQTPNHPTAVITLNQVHRAEPIDELLSRFWEMEEPSTPSTQAFTPEEESVQEHFLLNHKYLSSQCRYSVTLPRKPDMPALENSRQQAVQRYRSNEQSILRKQSWEPFQAVVQEYLDLGHAESVPSTSLDTDKEVYYLPMHAVTKASSTSTKLRVVFDASARSSNGYSLNDTLLIGPTLHPKLETILLKFRTYPVAITADISKMYRRVELAEEDRDLHRFVWRPHPSDPLTDYRMTRVNFGVAASPYLTLKALQQTALDFGQDHPSASSHVHASFYVDDLLAGANSPKEALALQTSLRALLLKDGFDLCKWQSSSPLVTESIDPSLREKLLIQHFSDCSNSPHPKALGLEWDSGTDTMSISLNIASSFAPTKRGIISDIAKTFDVLGWIPHA